MARQKSEFVSAFGTAFEVFKSLSDEVLSLGGNDDHLRSIISNRKVCHRLAELLVGNGSQADATFSLTCEGTKASELVAAGKYDWVDDAITDERFPIEAHAPVARKIELVGFDHDPSSAEALAEFVRRGLDRPTYEDALTFGVEHPEEQRKRPIVFLHEPARVHGYRVALVLYGSARERSLRLLRWFDCGWSRRYVFAGVRK